MRNPEAPLYERYPGDLFFRGMVIKQLTFPSGNGITQMFDVTPLKCVVEIVRVRDVPSSPRTASWLLP
jgi:hypothetical protein